MFWFHVVVFLWVPGLYGVCRWAREGGCSAEAKEEVEAGSSHCKRATCVLMCRTTNCLCEARCWQPCLSSSESQSEWGCLLRPVFTHGSAHSLAGPTQHVGQFLFELRLCHCPQPCPPPSQHTQHTHTHAAPCTRFDTEPPGVFIQVVWRSSDCVSSASGGCQRQKIANTPARRTQRQAVSSIVVAVCVTQPPMHAPPTT